jgi:hypothetical protein
LSGSTHTPVRRPQAFFYCDVFGHHFAQDLVLLPNLALQHLDSLRGLPGGRIGSAALEHHMAVLEELLLPPVEKRRVDAVLVADVRHGTPLKQVAAQDRHLLRCGVLSSPAGLLAHAELLAVGREAAPYILDSGCPVPGGAEHFQPALLFLFSPLPLLSLFSPSPPIRARRHKNHQREGTNGLRVSADRGRVKIHHGEV